MPADFRTTVHRPWPLPARPWAMAMNWHDLLFLHWPVAPEALRPFIPPALELDLHPDDGGRPSAWLGIVPFTMTGIRARFTPALPWFGAFHELNVRTYVRLPRGEPGAGADGRPGVWFFSLDAANPVAVATARATFHLPYFNARMTLAREGEAVRYVSRRTHRAAAEAGFEATYGPTGAPVPSLPGTLEHWLTERYCLYSACRRGRVYRADIHHIPWPLQPGEAEVRGNTMAAQLNLTLPDVRPLAHFARRIDVAAWLPERVAAGPG
jgi:uncharacterized protein YqjF (DUF2071 family)